MLANILFQNYNTFFTIFQQKHLRVWSILLLTLLAMIINLVEQGIRKRVPFSYLNFATGSNQVTVTIIFFLPNMIKKSLTIRFWEDMLVRLPGRVVRTLFAVAFFD